MPERVNEDRLRAFMRAAGAAARREGVCYLTGGATAVLLGWRGATLDIDVRLEPEQDELMRRLPAIKHDLRINVETASPAEFIPLPSMEIRLAVNTYRSSRFCRIVRMNDEC